MSPRKKKSYLKFAILVTLNCILLFIMGFEKNDSDESRTAKEKFENKTVESDEISFI